MHPFASSTASQAVPSSSGLPDSHIIDAGPSASFSPWGEGRNVPDRRDVCIRQLAPAEEGNRATRGEEATGPNLSGVALRSIPRADPGPVPDTPSAIMV